MKLKDKLNMGCKVANARLLGRRVPLLVGWALTNHCGLRCQYCDIRNLPSFEMPTQKVKGIIDEMAEMGTKCIQFTGGDAILRKDIGEILAYCHQKKIYTTLSCTGILVPQKINELKPLGAMGLSLDGGQEIHDFLRGEKTYQRVIKAAECLKKNNIRFKFVTVLTRFNLSEVDYVLDLADTFNCTVLFQPGIAKQLYNCQKDNTTIPESNSYKQTIEKIIGLKRKGKRIVNSFPALEHLKHWPYPRRELCPGGRIMVAIRNNGQVAVCSRINDGDFARNNCLEKGFKRAFEDLPSYGCDNCWASLHVESSSLLAFKPSTMFNAFKMV